MPSETTPWLPGFLEMHSRLTKTFIYRLAVHCCFKIELNRAGGRWSVAASNFIYTTGAGLAGTK